MKIDPMMLSILSHKVSAVADQMASTLQRTSRSVYVKEAADFGTGLADLKGKIFAYPHTNSVNSIDRNCTTSIEAFGDLEPGDVIITNDPYRSGGLATHLPDLHMIKPYFHGGKIVAYGWCFIHFMDIGGRVPSSISPSNIDVFQEGLQVPPTRILKRNKINKTFMNIFKANCRTPDQNAGDIRAMLSALKVGEDRVRDVIRQHGLPVFLRAQSQLQEYSALKAKEVLKRIPNGTYEFWDYMDDDFVTHIPLRVRVKMTVHDGSVNLDFTGTDPQVAAAYNVPTLGDRHPWLLMRLTSFILTYDKTMPLNAGLYNHVTVTNPKGTVLNAEYPDAVGIRSATARRLNDAVTGAILKASQDIMAAPTCGANAPLVLSEMDAAGDKRNVTVLEPLRGGMGALKGQDGIDARDSSMSNLKNHPLEQVELDSSVIIREYDVLPDSGGPGRWRGGVGQKLRVDILRDGGIILARGMERVRFPAWGVGGARPAALFRAILNEGRKDERRLAKIDELHVNAGDSVTIMTPGGSGFGDPFLRDPESVRLDVELGFVSRDAARRDYGVMISANGDIDDDATHRARKTRVRENVRASFDFGPEREAWEAVFDDALICDLNRRLYELPKPVRQNKRQWIFAQALPHLPKAGADTLASVLSDPDKVRDRLIGAIAKAFDVPINVVEADIRAQRV